MIGGNKYYPGIPEENGDFQAVFSELSGDFKTELASILTSTLDTVLTIDSSTNITYRALDEALIFEQV